MAREIQVLPVTFVGDASESDPIPLNGALPVGLETEASFKASNITFGASRSETATRENHKLLKDDAATPANIGVPTVAASDYRSFPATKLDGVVSLTVRTSVAQTNRSVNGGPMYLIVRAG